MGIGKPAGEYVEELTEPGGWPDADEDKLYDCAGELTRTLQQLSFQAAEPWAHERGETFDGGIWSGGAATAADGQAGTYAGQFSEQQDHLTSAITWNNHVAGMVVQAKSKVADFVEEAQQQIATIRNDSNLDTDQRSSQIQAVISLFHEMNVAVVTGLAAQIPAAEAWKPSPNALEQLLNQKSPPPAEAPFQPANGPQPRSAGSVSAPPEPAPDGQSGSSTNFSGKSPPANPQVSHAGTQNGQSGSGAAFSPQPSLPQSVPAGGPSAVMPTPSPPAAPMPAASSPGLSSPARTGSSLGSAAGAPLSPAASGLSSSAAPSSPAASTGQPGGAAPTSPQAGGPAQGLGQAPLGGAAAPVGTAAAAMDAAQAGSSTAAGTPAGAATSTTPPGAAATPVASAGLGSLGAAAGAGSGAPAAPMPLGPPPTPAPAAPASSTTSGQTAAAGQPSGTAGPSGPGVYPASAKDAGQVGAPAPIPVTAARAEREFLARATAAGAARRQSGGHDRLSLAKRIAAALNAPDQPGRSDHNFFWVTGVSTDGQIVVANSYGMAYIPDGVDLPNPVRLVSADAAVPAPLRARWTTYPFAAIAAWAAHHEVGLRAVIATEAQFAGVDPGAPKDVLHDDDIPPSGKMAGRHRLAVVDPATAAELAAVADWNLLELMPTAPVAADPPTDRRGDLWWDINKPTMSQASDRGDAQLKLFVPYVEHCMELALHQAHTGIHAQLQRQAVTDWYYWRFLHELLTEALTGAAAP